MSAEAEHLEIDALGGDDLVFAGSGLASLTQLTVDGGADDDIINGGDGNDVVFGGDGDDTVVGGGGDDVAFLGTGDDRFGWKPGDGNDTVEGQEDLDTLDFNGAGTVNEKIDLAANGQRLRLTRDIAGIVMDVDGIENVDVLPAGGVDTLHTHDLRGTDVTHVTYDLAGAPDGSGDGQADRVVVDGTLGDDVVTVAGDSNGATATGVAARVDVLHAEAANDTLEVDTFAGDDVADGSSLVAGAPRFVADGGDGNDVLIGGDNDDTLIGGAGDDVLLGGPGLDVLNAAPGNDIVLPD